MPYELANASASSSASWTGATWTDQCCFVYIDDIIIYSRNAVELIYHLRLVSERLSKAGIKIKPADGKRKSMTYSSETEASKHSLAGGVIQKNGFYIQICRPSWILGSEMCFNTKLTSEMDSLWSN